MEGLSLRFRDGKPVPQPQPDGETVTVECAVFVRKDGTIMLDGDSKMSSVETAAAWKAEYKLRHVATVPVTIPVSLLSVPVLPTVNVSEQ